MDFIIWSIVIIALFVAATLFIVNNYNKLQIGRNAVNESWNGLRVAIQNQFALVEANYAILNGLVKMPELQRLVTSYKLTASIDDIMNDYCNLVRIIKRSNSALNPMFFEKNAVIAELKKTYNDNVLGYNNVVNMVPTNLIASWFSFKPATYFRVDEI